MRFRLMNSWQFWAGVASALIAVAGAMVFRDFVS